LIQAGQEAVEIRVEEEGYDTTNHNAQQDSSGQARHL
jgi:hypothetical protein